MPRTIQRWSVLRRKIRPGKLYSAKAWIESIFLVKTRGWCLSTSYCLNWGPIWNSSKFTAILYWEVQGKQWVSKWRFFSVLLFQAEVSNHNFLKKKSCLLGVGSKPSFWLFEIHRKLTSFQRYFDKDGTKFRCDELICTFVYGFSFLYVWLFFNIFRLFWKLGIKQVYEMRFYLLYRDRIFIGVFLSLILPVCIILTFWKHRDKLRKSTHEDLIKK